MRNTEDLILFAHIVEAGSFAAASRQWGVPRATLSRRLAHLEKHLGVSLINRTSRQFAVTDFGLHVYHHCLAIMTEVDRVYNEATDLQSEPSGLLRICCPIAIAHTVVGKIAANFAKRYKKVQLALEVTNRTVDPILERFDLVIRPTPSRLEDAEIIARKIAVGTFLIVAAPVIADTLPSPLPPEKLQHIPVIGFGVDFEHLHWSLKNTSGNQVNYPVNPVYASDSLFAIREAALAGLGVAALPEYICREPLSSGQLIHICPEWAPPPMEFFALYPSRRGLTAAGRRFIECMQKEMPLTLAVLD